MTPKRKPMLLDLHAFEEAAVPQVDPVRAALARKPEIAGATTPVAAIPTAAQFSIAAPTPPAPQKPAATLAPDAPVQQQPKVLPASNQASRAGKVQVQTWVSEEVRKQLKILAVNSGTTVEALLNTVIVELLARRQ